MWTNAQKSLIKRAQRAAGLPDSEYRDTLQVVTGCRTSTDEKLTDRDFDRCLAYMEAIFWRGVDAGRLQHAGSAAAIFSRRGYWASKNTSALTSRDRYTGRNQAREIAALESALNDFGFGQAYCAAIRKNVCHGRTDDHAQHLYRAALQRTLKAKCLAAEAAENPF